MGREEWLSLPYDQWRQTRATLHMYTQVLGKLRLALSPFEPGWANVALYVTPRGLTTSAVPAGPRIFDAELDLFDHVLVMRTDDGRVERRPLGGAVADFYRDTLDGLGRMGIEVAISELPSEVADPIPFPEDKVHDTYDPVQAHRFQRVLCRVDAVMKEHRAGFAGRTSPVHFFWGSFDLALTRYSGRPAEVPAEAGVIARFSADAEEICAGWWPGDERYPRPGFYAYVHPAPEGVQQLAIRPAEAAWDTSLGEWILPYEAAVSSNDPRGTVLEFLATTYGAAAGSLGWSGRLTDFSKPE